MTKDFFKKKENLIYIIILAVFCMVFLKETFKPSEKNKEENNVEVKEEALIKKREEERKDLLEQKLSRIISNIQGIEEAEVLVTYEGSEKIIPVYETKEEIKEKEKITEKNIAYEEDINGSKKVIVESNTAKKAQGVIVCIKGNIDINLKNEIKNAVAMVTDIPSHKVKIFNK